MLGLALVTQLLGGSPAPADDVVHDVVHRGHGWYSADLSVPEPPYALALVIVGVAGMRARERRMRRRDG